MSVVIINAQSSQARNGRSRCRADLSRHDERDSGDSSIGIAAGSQNILWSISD